MRLRLSFSSSSQIILPIHYNYILQSMLYRNLPEKLANFLHNSGFFYEKRRFKLFTFSRIFSKSFKILDEKIIFTSPIFIYISSAISKIPENFVLSLLKKESIMLGNNILSLNSIEVLKSPEFSEITTIKTLSPITVYSTIIKDNNKKFTKYFNPLDPEFKILIKENIKKKYSIITGKELKDFDFNIEHIGKFKQVPVMYKKNKTEKGYVVKAVHSKFKVKLSPEIFKAIYDAGLGAKNSQGFGMIEVLKK